MIDEDITEEELLDLENIEFSDEEEDDDDDDEEYEEEDDEGDE